MSWRPCRLACGISIHAPPRGATLTISLLFCSCPFQFTPLREGRLDQSHWDTRLTVFQFTPLREGRPRIFDTPDNAITISIHAPPRGATTLYRYLMLAYIISIHAPPRGATFVYQNHVIESEFQFTPLREGRHAQFASLRHALLFQFTPLREGRHPLLPPMRLQIISIHAPPRGATPLRLPKPPHPLLFQFTPLREGRRQKICNFCKSFVQPLQISMA